MTPYFSDFQTFIQMGGHANYVWACYGITFGCLLFLIWYAKNERKNMLDKLNHQSARTNKLTNKQRKQLSV